MLGSSINTLTRARLQNVVSCAIATNDQCLIANHNLHSLYLFHHDPKMRAVFAKARYTIVDGMSLVMLARLTGSPVSRQHRLTCLDYVIPLLRQAAQRGWSVYYIGSRPETLRQGAAALQEAIPGLRLGTFPGYFDDRTGFPQNAHVIREINAFRPDILLVGMGMPRQEHWLNDNLLALNARVVLTTGGFMDYVAGAIPTPPRWSGRLGIEWLARLCAEPGRLWRRYLLEPWFLLGLLARAPFRREDFEPAPGSKTATNKHHGAIGS